VRWRQVLFGGVAVLLCCTAVGSTYENNRP
jgi:hypothetical protein